MEGMTRTSDAPMGNNRVRSQGGGILFMFALLLPVFVVVLYFLITTSFSDVVLTQLQVAADNAAEGGASKLCSTMKSDTCFKQARAAAIGVLKQHTAMSGIEGTNSFNIAAIDATDPNKWSWDETDLAGHNLRVTIERGVWGKEWGSDGTGPYMFQSVENPESGAPFDDRYPGIPKTMITNAVRVQILRPHTGIFGGKYYSLEATSVAVNGNAGKTEVAPFAIPICALITNDGKYYADNGDDTNKIYKDDCLGDRIFTAGNRYEDIAEDVVAQGTDAGVPSTISDFVQSYPVPTFPWNPCSAATSPSSWPSSEQALRPKNTAYFTDQTTYDAFVAATVCSDCPTWDTLHPSGSTHPVCVYDHGEGRLTATVTAGPAGQQRFPQTQSHTGQALASERQPSDHFGVFGVPGFTAPDWAALEDKINVILGGSGTIDAYLGQKFNVLDPGPSSTETQTKLNILMSAGAGSTLGGDHPRIDSTLLGTIQGTYSNFGWSGSTTRNCNPGVVDPNKPCVPTAADVSRDGVVWWAGPSIGLNPLEGYCGSRRAQFSNFRVSYGPSSRPVAASSPSWTISADVTLAGADTDGVWDTKIPVIAPLDGDVDMACAGTQGRAYSDSERDPQVLDAKNWIIVGFIRVYMVDADINNPIASPDVMFGAFRHKIANWGYLGDDFVPSDTTKYTGTLTSRLPIRNGNRSCNMARGRLRCENHYLPSADGTAEKKPRLVK